MLSIIVAAYNVEKYINKCIESLLSQTYKNIEILVVNDGSTDNTEKIIQFYEKKSPLIKLLNKKNGGLSDARNFGITFSKGKYIAFVDGDDYIEPNTYTESMSLFEKEKSDLLIFNFQKIYENGKSSFKKMDRSLYDNNFISSLLSKSDEVSIVAWNKIFKKSIILENNIFFENKAYFEDTGFIFRYLFFVKKISISDIPFYNYIQRQGSLTKKFDSRIIFSAENTYNIIKNFYKEKNQYSKYKTNIEDMFIRMQIYILNFSLKNNVDKNKYQMNFKWNFLLKTKIPFKHRVCLLLYKIGIYQKFYPLIIKISRRNYEQFNKSKTTNIRKSKRIL